jgi:drug/metabolite transporter (DMT)-like permease
MKVLTIQRKAFFYVLLAAVLWASVGVFGRLLSGGGLVPFQIVFLRALGAAVLLGGYIAFKNPALFRIRIKDSVYFMGTGILSFAFFNWCYFTAVNNTSLSIAAILLYTAPVIVMVLSVLLFGEKLTAKKIGALVLTFMGCLLVTGVLEADQQSITLVGILAGLGAGFGYGLYSIFGRYALGRYGPLTVTFYTFAFASFAFMPWMDYIELFKLLSTPEIALEASALSLIGTVLPFLLYTHGLLHMESSKASILATLEPVVATIMGVLIFAEPLNTWTLVGIAMVLGAVYVLSENKATLSINNKHNAKDAKDAT